MKPGMLYLAALLVSPALPAATVTFNGAVTYQVIDGFGVNANARSWNNDELKPVLDALVDQAGMTLFRVVHDDANWETNNDNTNASVMNWSYYAPVYTSPDFTKLWNLVAYLNSKGVTTNGVMFNFMGPGPTWMGGGALTPGKEEEWAEMITSALVWARYTNGLQFNLVGPDNEPDISNEGITMSASRYTNCLHQLALKLDANGLGEVRLVGPDRAGGGTDYMPEMLADSALMAKLAHFGVHSYNGGGGGSAGVYSYLQGSAYPDRTFWVTEFNVWCPTCDSGVRGTYDWTYCKGTADYLLSHLLNNASGGIVWEGYDSFYLHPPTAWSFWGLFSVDNENAPVKTYTPRKNFYTFAQISKWVRPGSRRIGVSGPTSPIAPLLAFSHTNLGQLAIVGINTSASATTLNGTLASLPMVPHLHLHYTSATTNLAFGGTVTVTNTDGRFSATIPADCVFTLEYGVSRIDVTPTNAILAPGDTQQFLATVSDTQGDVLDPQPTYSWSATGGGTLDATGLFTAGSSALGQFNVLASSGGLVGTATVSIGPIPPVVSIAKFENGLFQIRSEGVPGNAYRIESTDALTAPGWQSLGSGTANEFGVVEYTDLLVTNSPARYYRSVGF